MADIVNSLFGLDSGQLLAAQRQRDQEFAGQVAGLYQNTNGKIGALVGANIGAGLARGLFGVNDPQIAKAKKFEQILSEVQSSVPSSDTVGMYKALADKLGQAGFGKEAAIASEKALALSEASTLNSAKLMTEQAQTAKALHEANKATAEKMTTLSRLQQEKEAALLDQRPDRAAELQSMIDKEISQSPKSAEEQTHQAVRNNFIERYGEITGNQKFAEWLTRQRATVSASQGTGTIVSPDGKEIGNNNKDGSVTLANGRRIDEKTWAEYTKGHDVANTFLDQLNHIEDADIDTAFGKLADMTTGTLAANTLALQFPETAGAQVKIQALRVKDTLDNLAALKGSTSDRDLRFVVSTFPGYAASPQAMRDWMVRAKAATLNFLQKNSETYGFEQPENVAQDFITSPTFLKASRPVREKAIKDLSKNERFLKGIAESDIIGSLASGDSGAEVKTDKGITWTYKGVDYVRPKNFTQQQWDNFKKFHTSGGKQ